MTIATLPIPNFMRPSARRRSAISEELLVDNFAGGGGASTGIELALGRSVDIAINHDAEAVEMHARNHPDTRHLCEDVWAVDPVEVVKGRPVGLAWFSPDCKHFSRAKGSKPVSKKIRGLAWVAVKWAKAVRPRIIMLENVREFQEWGPLTADFMPCKKRKGQTFGRFVAMLRNLGYVVEWKILNAADFGAPTHRRRLFLVARCDGQPIMWPEPTHGPGRLPYRTAAECIDWSIPCPSIFTRKRPLAEKTLRRIAAGLRKYVIENPKPFIVNVQHGGEEFRGQSIDTPLQTVTAKHGYGVVSPYLVKMNHGIKQWYPVTAPLCTVLAGANHHAVITPYLVQRNGEAPGQDPRAMSVDRPINTVTPGANAGVLIAPHLVEVANGGWNHGGRPTDAPCPTITATPKGGSWAMCAAFLAKHYGGVVGHGVERPVGTVTAVDHHSLVTSHLEKFYGTAQSGAPVDSPLPTITATGWHIGEVRAFLIKYFGCGVGQEVAEPLHTVTTRDRFGLVTVQGQEYQIVDIGLRMLSPRELLRAQFGPELAADYVLPKSASAAVAKIGNSVAPLVAAALVLANVPTAKAKRRTG